MNVAFSYFRFFSVSFLSMIISTNYSKCNRLDYVERRKHTSCYDAYCTTTAVHKKEYVCLRKYDMDDSLTFSSVFLNLYVLENQFRLTNQIATVIQNDNHVLMCANTTKLYCYYYKQRLSSTLSK
jgi:hypothetical protein